MARSIGRLQQDPRPPPEETERFFKMWIPLLHYVNTQRHVVRSFPATWPAPHVPVKDVKPLRDALWANDDLRERFIAENPARLPEEDLAIIVSWQHRVAGHFFVFRYLKKHTIFLSARDPVHAYGVLGLVSAIEEIAGPVLPVYVEAVLLPFGERIIYDSLLVPYNVYFGGGIRRDLQETYRHLLEREGLITKLPWQPYAEDAREGITERNALVLKAFRRELGAAGLSPTTLEGHYTTIDDFAAMLAGQTPPRGLLEVQPADLFAYLGAASRSGPALRSKGAAVSLRRFVRFLRDTGRVDWDQAEALRDALK